ncbi:hypothetical protein [Nostoc sp.]
MPYPWDLPMRMVKLFSSITLQPPLILALTPMELAVPTERSR